MFIVAAKTLAALVTEEDLNKGSLYPPLEHIQNCSVKIAVKVMEYSYEKGLASVRPEPEDKESFIKAQMYQVPYKSALPAMFEWPN